ncbi:MAG: hypothetical protein HYX69_15155 [Planctomycetia bacterium]|nr:hypothetical protein [Planctomycetia bacterium]
MIRASILATSLLSVVLLATNSHATILSMAADIEFSNATAPSGPAPWLTVTINDHGGSGSVTLDIAGSGLSFNESVSELSLNLDPSLDPANLVFSAPTKSRAFTTPTIATAANAFKADGDGFYDIDLAFAVGSGASTFRSGDSIEYTITGIASLNALSFNFLSKPAGGHGPFIMAAHVQNTGGAGGGSSGWVTDSGGGQVLIPEPATCLLAALAGLGILVVRRRIRG